MTKIIGALTILLFSFFVQAEVIGTQKATPKNPATTTELKSPASNEFLLEAPKMRYFLGRTTIDLDNASDALGFNINAEYTMNQYLALGASTGQLKYDYITDQSPGITVGGEETITFISVYASIIPLQTRSGNYGFVAAVQLGGFFPYTSYKGLASEFTYGASLEADYKRTLGLRFEHKLTDASGSDINSISSLSLVGYIN